MTIINNIEIDNIEYTHNQIKEAILNNETIEDKLHVVIVISNPCLYARRYILIREFINRFEIEESNVLLYVVEMVYKNQRFLITDEKNPRHLRLHTTEVLWHKENMINLGIEKLLPKNWKAVAWIDSDLEFENTTWATDTLKILNGSRDIIQIFSHCVDMDIDNNTMSIFSSFGYQYTKKRPYFKNTMNYWHPGYAWACTRRAYEKMGGLYERSILGSADNIMALSLIGKGLQSINDNSTEDYKNSVLEYQNKVKNFRLGYVPGVIRHYFHGSKKNRKYMERWQILLKYNFSPSSHLIRDKNGVLIPTENCPKEILNDIFTYFAERNEDEFVLDKIKRKISQEFTPINDIVKKVDPIVNEIIENKLNPFTENFFDPFIDSNFIDSEIIEIDEPVKPMEIKKKSIESSNNSICIIF
jgi:hypothetical protein